MVTDNKIKELVYIISQKEHFI